MEAVGHILCYLLLVGDALDLLRQRLHLARQARRVIAKRRDRGGRIVRCGRRGRLHCSQFAGNQVCLDNRGWEDSL